MSVPDRSEYDGLEEWVEGVVDATGVSEDIVWAIIYGVKPGASAVTTSDNGKLLRRLLRYHSEYMQAHLEEHGRPDADCKVQIFFDDKVVYEFLLPSHNVVDLNEGQKQQAKEIFADEGMDIQSEGDCYLTGFLPEGEVDDEVRVIARVLDRVYESDFGDIDRAVEIRGQQRFSWTDERDAEENIADVSTGSSRVREDAADGTSNGSPTGQNRNYDSWIFCQNCGERVNDPEENPRFCSNCRE
jgi:hypothetical protein